MAEEMNLTEEVVDAPAVEAVAKGEVAEETPPVMPVEEEYDEYADAEAAASLDAMSQDYAADADLYAPVDGSSVSGDSGNEGTEVTNDGLLSAFGTKSEELQDIMHYEGSYKSTLARVLDNIGNVFGDNAIGNWLHNLAEKVEGNSQNTRDAFTEEIMSRSFSGTTEPETDASQDTAMKSPAEMATPIGDGTVPIDLQEQMTAQLGTDPQAFVANLHTSAEELDVYNTDKTGMAYQLSGVIGQNTNVDRVGTGLALQTFGQEARQMIDTVYAVGSEEHTAALGDLSVVMGHMTESYYGTIYDQETHGQILSASEAAEINALHFEGVEQPYSVYLPQADVRHAIADDEVEAMRGMHEASIGQATQLNRLQSTDDVDIVRQSDGSWYAGGSEAEQRSIQNMVTAGHEDVANGAIYANAASSENYGFSMSEMVVNNKAARIHEEYVQNSEIISDPEQLRQVTVESYMSYLKGYQAYNDAAMDAINLKYADNPEGRDKAVEGLAKQNRAVMGHTFDFMKSDDEALHLFSDADRAEIDNMQLVGVNVDFSHYQPGMNMKTGLVNGDKVIPQITASNFRELVEPGSEYDAMYGVYGTAENTSPMVARQQVVEPVVAQPSESRVVKREQPVAAPGSRYQQAMENSTIAAAMQADKMAKQAKTAVRQGLGLGMEK